MKIIAKHYGMGEQKCTLCGKPPRLCECKCTWCGNRLWKHEGWAYVHHVCGNRRVKGAR